MKIFEAIKELESESIVLIDTLGNKYQRLSKTQIMQVVESFGEDNEISLKVDEKWQPIVEDILSSK